MKTEIAASAYTIYCVAVHLSGSLVLTVIRDL